MDSRYPDCAGTGSAGMTIGCKCLSFPCFHRGRLCGSRNPVISHKYNLLTLIEKLRIIKVRVQGMCFQIYRWLLYLPKQGVCRLFLSWYQEMD